MGIRADTQDFMDNATCFGCGFLYAHDTVKDDNMGNWERVTTYICTNGPFPNLFTEDGKVGRDCHRTTPMGRAHGVEGTLSVPAWCPGGKLLPEDIEPDTM